MIKGGRSSGDEVITVKERGGWVVVIGSQPENLTLACSTRGRRGDSKRGKIEMEDVSHLADSSNVARGEICRNGSHSGRITVVHG